MSSFAIGHWHITDIDADVGTHKSHKQRDHQFNELSADQNGGIRHVLHQNTSRPPAEQRIAAILETECHQKKVANVLVPQFRCWGWVWRRCEDAAESVLMTPALLQLDIGFGDHAIRWLVSGGGERRVDVAVLDVDKRLSLFVVSK